MKDLSWLKTTLIAHRGLHTQDGSIPENSLPAFEKALSMGFGIECDLNILKDHTVIVFHDANLNRLCGKDITLKDATFNDIKAITYKDTMIPILTFEALLKTVRGQVPLLIELKPFGDKIALCRQTIELLKEYPGPYALFSFHPKIIYWLKKHHPHIIRGQISSFFRTDHINRLNKIMGKKMVFNPFTKPDFISYELRDLPNKYAQRALKKGLPVISFAAQNQTDFDRIKNLYDNVVFEYFIPK